MPTQKTIVERPILFSSEMVKAILENRKTQTRRVITHPERYERIRECGFCCPYGQAGDRLWVRETFSIRETETKFITEYKAGGLMTCPSVYAKWKPSIFMPRWASRITLEITGIRVERVQEISKADAQAEGCPRDFRNEWTWYQELWDSINSKRGYSWADNPWVFVITFKRID